MELDKIVVFTGYLEPEKINEMMNLADIGLVYYKKKEVNRHRVSMKIREMLGAGLAVVCNDFGDLKQFRDVSYQSHTSAVSFSEAIVKAIKSSNRWEGLGKKGHALIEKQYNWNIIGKEFSNKLQQELK